MLVAGCWIVVLAAFATPAFGSVPMRTACEPAIELSVEATAAYDSAYGRYLDGIISNDSTVNVGCPVVEVSWLEDADRVERVWPRADGMKPGDWTAFHLSWPDDVPVGWTPIVTAGGYQTERTALRLRVDEVVQLVPEGAIAPQCVEADPNLRSYVATVTNDAAFPVSSIELIGAEWDGESLVDAVWSWDEPCVLQPGESARIEFHGKAPTSGSPVPDVFVEARERPVITLDADTLAPYYGSPITFTLKLTNSAGEPLAGCRTLKLFYSADQRCWSYVPRQTETGTAVIRFTPAKPLYFKALYWGDDTYGMTESAVIRVVPRVVNTDPNAPEKVEADRKFRVHGRVSAGAKSAGKPVYLRLYRYSHTYDKWVYKASVKTTADSAGRYSRSMTLSKRGSWKVRAYRSGAGYSGYERFKVR